MKDSFQMWLMFDILEQLTVIALFGH